MSKLCCRYALYTKTRLGYMYYRRQLKKARELYPAGHSTALPADFNGLHLLCVYVVYFVVFTAEIIASLSTFASNGNVIYYHLCYLTCNYFFYLSLNNRNNYCIKCASTVTVACTVHSNQSIQIFNFTGN